MIDTSVERGTASRTLEGVSGQDTLTRKRGICAGCGTTTKALTAPRPNARDYEGPMYCLSCNPRFGEGGIDELLERMGG